MKLSVVISAFNEEKNLSECLESIKGIADEIIVIDNESTDKTKDIAKKFTKHVFTRPNNKILNINKNYGFEKATSDWILSLDADERITPDLAAEIPTTLSNPTVSAYRIPRKNIIFNKWIEHTGWYPDYQTRLFRKGEAKFAEKHNHEQLTVNGEIDELEYPLYHEHYKTIDEFLKKTFFSYTENEADELINNGYSLRLEDFINKPFQEFLSRYFARQGYKDGAHGLALSLLMSLYHFVVILKVWEKEKFKDTQEDTRNVLTKQAVKMKNEIKHWNTEIEIKKMSPIRKTVEKVKRKLI